MEILSQWVLRGPNVWARFPVCEAIVDLGRWRDRLSQQIPGFNSRLMAWLPEMLEHHSGHAGAATFGEELARGVNLAEALERVTLELQSRTGTPVVFGRTRETSQPGIFRVAIKFEVEELAAACWKTAVKLVLAAATGAPFDFAEELQALRKVADRYCLGPSTWSIAQAAQNRGIPVRRLNNRNLVQLGHGVRQHRICTAVTDRTSIVAESIAQDKHLTKSLLKAVGVPVPEGRPVESPEDAWKAACEVGLPVVVKPQDANHGRGVSIKLTTEPQITAAFHYAAAEGTGVMVEQFAAGLEHRLLVVGDRLIAASCGEPEQVVGSGEHTIAELVDELNRDPRRGRESWRPLTPVELDAAALILLEQQGYRPDSVPARGETVLVHRNGDYTIDATGRVHPDTEAHAVHAAQVIGLDIAGIDLIVEDISQPLEPQRGMVVEVNAGPGLHMHIEPIHGVPRPVGESIVDLLFPDGDNGRIPLVAVTGDRQPTATAQLIAHLLGQQRRQVGLACGGGIFVGGRQIKSQRGDLPQCARDLLLNPVLEAAVLEVDPASILNQGLGFDRCDVAVIAGVAPGQCLVGIPEIALADDGAGVDGSGATLNGESWFALERIVVDAAPSSGFVVLNALDKRAMALMPQTRARVILFANCEHDSLLDFHRAAGERVVFLRGAVLILAQGDTEFALGSLGSLDELAPAAAAGPWNEEVVLTAVAAAWAAAVPVDLLRLGLRTSWKPAAASPADSSIAGLELRP